MKVLCNISCIFEVWCCSRYTKIQNHSQSATSGTNCCSSAIALQPLSKAPESRTLASPSEDLDWMVTVHFLKFSQGPTDSSHSIARQTVSDSESFNLHTLPLELDWEAVWDVLIERIHTNAGHYIYVLYLWIWYHNLIQVKVLCLFAYLFMQSAILQISLE